MVFPLLTATSLGAGAMAGLGSIAGLGGLAMGRRDRDHAEHRDDRMAAADRKWQEMIFDSSIQRRVRDAKKAGLHPLAALNAQISSPVISSTPSPMPYYPDVPKGPSGVDAAQIRLLNKQADFIDEQIADSRLARLGQAITPQDNLVVEQTPPTRTPHLQTGGKVPWKTNPNWVDAEALTKRYGESELLELALALIIGSADFRHNNPKLDAVISAKGTPGRDGPDWLYRFVTPKGGK